MDEDIGFTFDFDPFTEGINKVTEKLKVMGSVALKIAAMSSGAFGVLAGAIGGKVVDALQKSNSTMEKERKESKGLSAWLIAKGNLIANAITGLARKAWSEFKAGLPELEKTFSIAQDIILRNLFWPIRQIIAPYLQKVLNWVRDNRGLFVKMGGVIVNAFQIIKSNIQNLFAIIRSIWDSFSKRVEGFIQPIKKSWDEIINMIMFKFTAVLMFIGQIFEAVGELIGTIMGEVAVFIKNFFVGVTKVISENMDVINDVMESLEYAFNEIRNAFSMTNDEMDKMATIAQTIGKIFGTGLVIALRTFATAVRLTVDVVKSLVLAMQALTQATTGDIKGAWETLKKIGEIGAKDINVIGQSVTKSYETIKYAYSGTTPELGKAKTNNVTQNQIVSIDKVEVHTKATDAKGISKDIGGALDEQLKKVLRNSMVIQGAQ